MKYKTMPIGTIVCITPSKQYHILTKCENGEIGCYVFGGAFKDMWIHHLTDDTPSIFSEDFHERACKGEFKDYQFWKPQ